MDPILSLISISAKAGRCISGEAVITGIREGKVRLLVLSRDASENTKKRANDKANYRNVPVLLYGTKKSLGNAIGRKNRAILGITDPGLSAAILEKNRLLRSEDGKENL